MKDELIKLVTLQKFDSEYRDIQNDIKGSTQKVEQDEQRLAKAEQQYESKKKEAQLKQVHSDRLDQDIKAFELRYKECNYQLMSLKDQKAYDAMKTQLQELRDQISSTESEGIEVLNELEELNKTVTMYKEKIDEEHKRIGELKESMKTQLEEKGKELEALKLKRDSYAENISSSTVDIYNRLLGLPDGKPLAEVQDRTCIGCYSTITLEDLESVKMAEKIITCNQCGRILYIPAQLGAAEVS